MKPALLYSFSVFWKGWLAGYLESMPAAAVSTQLHSVRSTSSWATAPAIIPSLTRVTARFSNSAVYVCFGIFMRLSLLE
jgi:hypothetical protein